MKFYQGKSVFGGIAIGEIRVFKKSEQQVKRVRVEDTEAELNRYHEAKKEVLNQLGQLYERALKRLAKPMQRYLKFIR